MFTSVLYVIFTLGLMSGAGAISGVATFNDYTTQSGVVCPGFHPTNDQGTGIFAAALGDLSPLWTGKKCLGAPDKNKCNGSGGCKDCAGPPCPDEAAHNCGKCFNISCTGPLDAGAKGKCSGKTIKVKIVDACPASHPANFCKLSGFGGKVPANQACEAQGTDAIDIASTARSTLSTFGGNLAINIQPVNC